MSKNRRNILIIVLSVLLFIVLLVEFWPSRRIDWRPTFENDDKIPYGTYIMYDFLKDVFPNCDIEENEYSIYYLLDEPVDEPTNYIIIDQHFHLDSIEWEYLQDFVYQGNDVFLAATTFDDLISEELGFTSLFSHDSLNEINFVNPDLKADNAYSFPDSIYHSLVYFASIDTGKTSVLAVNTENKAVLIKQAYGNGHFFVSTTPFFFTNLILLDDNNSDYAFKALSYLPVQNVIWDEYYKPFNIRSASGGFDAPRSRFTYILSRPALKAALFMLLLAVLLYILFEGKRRQRIIPIIKPLPNTSLEFTETIGRLYHHRRNHKDIAEKRMIYLLEFLRSHYHLKTNELNKDFLERVAQKTLVAKSTLAVLFEQYANIQNSKSIDTETLQAFNKQLETFYKQCR